MRQLLFSVGAPPWGARPRKWVYKCLCVYPGQLVNGIPTTGRHLGRPLQSGPWDRG